MKQKKITSFAAVVAIPMIIAAAATPAQAQPAIEWYPGSAVAVGPGCSSVGDVAFISFGNTSSVLLSNFGINLPAGGPNTALSVTKTCSLRIPVKLRKGFYFSEIVKLVAYGISKSANTTMHFDAVGSTFGIPFSWTVYEPYGAKILPLVTRTKATSVLLLAACGGADLSGFDINELTLSGTRASQSETLIVGAQGLDFRYDTTIPVLLCPFP